jgi:argininosuccinate synthase
VRFELSVKALAPDLKIIAPWREWDIKSREQAIDYAQARGIPVPVTKERPYSMDRNLWHLSHEGGDLEDPWNGPPEDLFELGLSPMQAPDKPAFVQIDFEEGIPTAVNGSTYAPIMLLEKLNEMAGANGIGIVDMVENRLVGMKSRGIYETPGGTLLYAAHQALEHLTLDRATLHYKELVAHKYAELVYDGMWFSPLREALAAFVDVTQHCVTGSVRLQLYKGNCILGGTRSQYSLYSHELATFGEEDVYNQKDAEGFINLFGLPLKVRALMERNRDQSMGD